MTRQRNDNHGTEFGFWLRNQLSVDSGLGYVATNIDLMWSNHKTGKWMLIEEKRHNANITFCQQGLFKIIDKALENNNKYYGFHVLRFEKTCPEDGLIRLDSQIINPYDLLLFLKFEGVEYWYISYFKKVIK